jgi:hypothetical protein
MQSKRRFKLTARCVQCGYQISKEVICDLENLTSSKNQFAKEAASIHKQHPEVTNFDISNKLL